MLAASHWSRVRSLGCLTPPYSTVFLCKMAHNVQPVHETLPEWNLARANLATSLQTYLSAFSDLVRSCSHSLDSKELDISWPDVRATLDQEIHSLVDHQASIAHTRTKLLGLKSMTTLESPIKKLPAEILARIFISVVSSCRVAEATMSRRDRLVSQVNSISSVCSSWRRIALNTGRLWSYINVRRIGHPNYVNLWVQRAGSCPVDIIDTASSGRYGSSSSLVLSRAKCIRSMVSSSPSQLMERWISEWCANGVPHTLTTLALSSEHGKTVGFPAQDDSIDQQRLTELFYSLDTLYLKYIRVDWDSLMCHNLVTLSLLHLSATKDALRHILMANPNLQHIHLESLDIADASTSFSLPLIQLDRLCSLHLDRFEYDVTCQLLAMMAPGSCGFTLKMDNHDTLGPEHVSRREFVAFCKRSQLRELHCRSRDVLQDVIAAGSKLEVLCLESMILNDAVYDLIVPPVGDGTGLPSKHLQTRLPHLHSLYVYNVCLERPEGFRRFVSVCPIREVGLDQSCRAGWDSVYRIEDFKRWVGKGRKIPVVMKRREMGYAPFNNQ